MSDPLNQPGGRSRLTAEELKKLTGVLRRNADSALRFGRPMKGDAAPLSPENASPEEGATSVVHLWGDVETEEQRGAYLDGQILESLRASKRRSRTGTYPAVRTVLADVLRRATAGRPLAAAEQLRFLAAFAEAALRRITSIAGAAQTGHVDDDEWKISELEPLSFWSAEMFPHETLRRVGRLTAEFADGAAAELRADFLLRELLDLTAVEVERWLSGAASDDRLQRFAAARVRIYGTDAEQRALRGTTLWVGRVATSSGDLLKVVNGQAATVSVEWVGGPGREPESRETTREGRIAVRSDGRSALVGPPDGAAPSLVLTSAVEVRRPRREDVVQFASPAPDVSANDAAVFAPTELRLALNRPPGPSEEIPLPEFEILPAGPGRIVVRADRHPNDPAVVLFAVAEFDGLPPQAVRLFRTVGADDRFEAALPLPEAWTGRPSAEHWLLVRDLTHDDVWRLDPADVDAWLAERPHKSIPCRREASGDWVFALEADGRAFLAEQPEAGVFLRM